MFLLYYVLNVFVDCVLLVGCGKECEFIEC